jgi:hypothetical protein
MVFNAQPTEEGSFIMAGTEKRAGVELPELRALDPDLPIVAARAAMQLDTVISAIKSKSPAGGIRSDAIDQLAKMISTLSTSIVTDEAGERATRSLMDPLTATIVSRAYAEASQANLNSLADLRAAADELSAMFKQASGKPEGGKDPLVALTLLRDFCVKLSEYAASKRQLAYGERPTLSSYRRLT